MECNIKNKYQNKENTIFDIDKLIKRLIFVLKIKEWKINDQA